MTWHSPTLIYILFLNGIALGLIYSNFLFFLSIFKQEEILCLLF
jgi:hypothetical protein